MFYHNFIYSLKTLFRSKMLLFWTFAFPIILGTFFSLAFSDIEKNEKLEVINIAVVESDEFNNNEIFKEALNTISQENESQVFDLTITDIDNSKQLLIDKNISGYLEFNNDEINITVNSSGINETIIRFVVDEIRSKQQIIETLSEKEIEEQYKNGNFNIDYEKIYTDIINLIDSQESNLKDISNNNLSYTMIEYYSLIAMAALYGGMISMVVVNYKLANMNGVGKRTSISPIKKSSILLGSLLASFIVQLIGLALLFLYTIFVLKVDYGSNFLLVLLLAVVGSLAGLTLGVAVAVLVKSNDNTKTGGLLAFIMFCCFLSGMVGITMKYVIDTNFPILNQLNPASMITDGFYSLYYYDTLNRFYFDLISLGIFSLLMIFISFKGLRRQKYDSI